MRVAVKSPGKPWEHMWVENKLDTLQHIVGGYIEHTTTRIMCEDDRKLIQAAAKAAGRSPLQIVEAVEREFRAEMNPYCLSVGERATLEVIDRIKADLRKGGWG